MSEQNSRLLMVYNANGGIANMVLDGLHKLISPSTYPCSLCALTWGPVAMRSRWREFLDNLGLDAAFYHKDEFAEAYPEANPSLPAILIEREGDAAPSVLVASDELNALRTLDELIEVVERRLSEQREAA